MKDFLCFIKILISRLYVKVKNFLYSIINLGSVTKTLGNFSIPKDEEEILDYKKYTTESKYFSTWVDVIFNMSPISYISTSIILGVFIYLGGLLLAWTINFHYNYITTFPIYLGVFGVSFVCCAIRFGSQQVHDSYEQLRPCFLIYDSQYNYVIKKWYERASNNQGHFIFSLFFIFFGWATVYFQIYQQEFLTEMGIKSFGPAFFSEKDWYTSEGKNTKAFILCYYAVFVSLPLGTAARILLHNFFLLLDFRNFPVIPVSNLLRGRLRKTADFYIIISVTWFVGVALFGILFFDNVDVVSITLIVLMSLLGILTFITPQIVYRIFLTKSELLSNQWTTSSFYEYFNIKLVERENNALITIEEGKSLTNLKELKGFADTATPVKLWVYDMTDVLTFIGGQALAILSPWLIKYLKNFEGVFF